MLRSTAIGGPDDGFGELVRRRLNAGALQAIEDVDKRPVRKDDDLVADRELVAVAGEDVAVWMSSNEISGRRGATKRGSLTRQVLLPLGIDAEAPASNCRPALRQFLPKASARLADVAPLRSLIVAQLEPLPVRTLAADRALSSQPKLSSRVSLGRAPTTRLPSHLSAASPRSYSGSSGAARQIDP